MKYAFVNGFAWSYRLYYILWMYVCLSSILVTLSFIRLPYVATRVNMIGFKIFAHRLLVYDNMSEIENHFIMQTMRKFWREVTIKISIHKLNNSHCIWTGYLLMYFRDIYSKKFVLKYMQKHAQLLLFYYLIHRETRHRVTHS